MVLLHNECFDGACSDDEEDQAWVVQKVDSAIHRINHYPADSAVCFVNIYPLNSDLSDE